MANSPLIGLRIPQELLEALDEARGPVDRSTWIRQVLEDRLMDSEAKAVREVLEYARQRGVSTGALANALMKNELA